jgi:hypothetical protein
MRVDWVGVLAGQRVVTERRRLVGELVELERLEDHIDLRRAGRAHECVKLAAHDDKTTRSVRRVRVHTTHHMRVVPEDSRRVVDWHAPRILPRLPRMQLDEDVVIVGRRLQAVRVDVYGARPVRIVGVTDRRRGGRQQLLVDALGRPARALEGRRRVGVVGRQPVVERQRKRLSGRHLQEWRRATPAEAHQANVLAEQAERVRVGGGPAREARRAARVAEGEVQVGEGGVRRV